MVDNVKHERDINADFVVNPWEVKGNIDYAKLQKQFGLKSMSDLELPKTIKESLLFRRGIVFAHRDFDKIINAINQKKRFGMMTGLMPSGKMHFGHKMVVDQIKMYQELGAKIYIAVADVEAYNSRNLTLEQINDYAINEYLINYSALGLDLTKCDFYFQSMRSLDGKRASAYYGLAEKLSKHVTFNEMQAIYGELTPGKISSALLQASDILHMQLPEFENYLPVVVPVGTDQDPHLRLTRDLASRYKENKFMQISATYHTFCPGLNGGKMSSSDITSHIALTDLPEDAEKKVKKYAFSGGRNSLEEHRKCGGNIDVDVSFQMLKYGLEPNDKKLQEIANDYKSGKLLSGELKQITADKLQSFLSNHHKQRVIAKKKVELLLKKKFDF